MAKRKTKTASEIIRGWHRHDPQMQQLIEDAKVNAHVAQLIYDARTAAGLTQKQLADLIGSTQPMISQLEDSDYEGHSLTMLNRIAEALHLHLEINLVPPPEEQEAA